MRCNTRTSRLGSFVLAGAVAVVVACSDNAEARPRAITEPGPALDQGVSGLPVGAEGRAHTTLGGDGPGLQQLTLPFFGTINHASYPFVIKNTSATAGVAWFESNGTGTLGSTLYLRNNVGGKAILATNLPGVNTSILAQFDNNGSGSAVDIQAQDSVAMMVLSTQSGRAARFTSCTVCTREVVLVENRGTGPAILASSDKSAEVAQLKSTSTSSVKPAFAVTNAGLDWAGTFTSTSATGKGVLVTTAGGAGLQVVGGSKNAVVGTSSGARALYTEESSEVWFTDYGFGRLGGSRAHIAFDPVFAETIARGEAYHVFVQAYGASELYVANRTPSGFDVILRAGDAQTEFSYRIVAKRRGFEDKRLERAPWADSTTRRMRPF